MKVLVTGANGQLGRAMQRAALTLPQHEFCFADIQVDNSTSLQVDKLDITDAESVKAYTIDNQIDIIVNCAAYTAVDKAEENEETAYLLNATAVANLAATGCKVIHVSTDYVFSGDASLPYLESDAPNPRTAYGRTKLAGEQALMSLAPSSIIFRTAWLYSPDGNNFVKTMLRLGKERDEIKVVFDQIGTPTSANTLAMAICAAIENKEWHAGIYHLTDEGVCSWYDFTVEIMRQAGLTTKVTPIRSFEYPSKTPRPQYSVLDKTKAKQTFGLALPHWTVALQEVIQTLTLNPVNHSV